MLYSVCPDCGGRLVADKEAVARCADCGKKLDYRSLDISVRRELDHERWLESERANEKQKSEAAERIVHAPRIVVIVLAAALVAALVAVLVVGDMFSFARGAVALTVGFFVVFAALVASAARLFSLERKYRTTGVGAWFLLILPLVALLIAAIVGFSIGLSHHGDILSGDYILTRTESGLTIVDYRGSGARVSIIAEADGGKVTAIGDGVFSGRREIVEIVVPEGIVTIGEGAFENLGALAAIDLPSSLRAIGTNAFRGAALSAIELGSALAWIGDGAFAGMDSLVEIALPDSLEKVGRNAFMGCDALETIVAPFVGERRAVESVVHLGFWFGAVNYDGNARSLPAALSSVVVNGERVGANTFFGCAQLESILLPNVRHIGDSAFAGCTGIAVLSLPDSLEFVGGYSFSGWTESQTIGLASGVSVESFSPNWFAQSAAVLSRA